MALRLKGLNGGDVDFDQHWSVLEKAFVEVFTKNASILSFEELYRNAYKIVLKKQGADLYNRTVQFVDKWLSETIRARVVQKLGNLARSNDNISRSLGTSSERRVAGEGFLAELKLAYSDHKTCMAMVTDVLMYMVGGIVRRGIPESMELLTGMTAGSSILR
jgi:cullin 3